MSTPTERLHAAVTEHVAAGSAAGTQEPGLTLDVLGPLDEVTAQASELAADPEAHLVAQALAHAGTTAGEALRAFSTGLAAQRSPLTLLESVDALLGEEHVVAEHGAHLHDVLLPTRAEQAKDQHLATIRLETCVRLVLLGARPPWAVLGALSDPTQHPAEHQQRLGRLVGVLLDAAGGPAVPAAARPPLLAALRDLVAGGNADAIVEMAVDEFRQALSADAHYAPAAITTAVKHLRDASHEQENRLDAALLATAGEALLALHERDVAAVRAAAEAAQAAADTIALHLRGMHVRHWTGARRATQAGWLTFAADLARLAGELEHDSFLDTNAALVVVGNAYARARTVSPAGLGSSIIVRARIENDLASKGAMLRQLDRALDLDRQRVQPVLTEGAHLLAEVMREQASSGRSTSERPGLDAGEEGGDSEPEPAAADTSTAADPSVVTVPALVRLVGRARATALLRGPGDPAAFNVVATALLQDDIAGVLPDDDPIMSILEERLLNDLALNEHFTGETQTRFWRLARLIVRFVRHTLNVGAPYLRPFASRDQAPREAELQRGFLEWLSLTMPDQFREVPDAGTGRADVVTVFGAGHNFVTEIKREFDDASDAALESKYLSQAATYQVTSVPFGGLLTLDLTAHRGIAPHLLDLVWVAHRTPAGSSVTRTVVCATVIGNRPAPSATR